MPKDPNEHVDPNQGENDDGKKPNTVNISADDWRNMQNNMKHMNYTVKNLSTKLEDAHKDKQNQQNKSDKSDKSSDDVDKARNTNPTMQKKIDELTKSQAELESQLKAKSHRSALVKYAKGALKKNNMKVNSATFKHIIGKDTDSIDNNIDWYKPIYQKLNTNQTKFPKSSHHHKSKVNIGTELGKTLGNDGVREKWSTNK